MHPTLGAFWGMGVGIGCGVGWGPGFGPEVIGYVGAGCGVGFSVGVTLAGIGIGLPVNGVVQIQHDACISSNGTLEFARSNALSTMNSAVIGFKLSFAPYMTFLMKETFGSFSSLKNKASLLQTIEINKLNQDISSHLKSALESFHGFRNHGWPPGQGWED